MMDAIMRYVLCWGGDCHRQCPFEYKSVEGADGLNHTDNNGSCSWRLAQIERSGN